MTHLYAANGDEVLPGHNYQTRNRGIISILEFTEHDNSEVDDENGAQLEVEFGTDMGERHSYYFYCDGGGYGGGGNNHQWDIMHREGNSPKARGFAGGMRMLSETEYKLQGKEIKSVAKSIPAPKKKKTIDLGVLSPTLSSVQGVLDSLRTGRDLSSIWMNSEEF